jgi:hypothetical protein
MAFQCISTPEQAVLPLAGGASGLPLTFAVTASGRHFAAAYGGYIYEVLPVPLQTLWQARIRSEESGSEIDCRIFGFKQLTEAQSWLQGRAIRLGGAR